MTTDLPSVSEILGRAYDKCRAQSEEIERLRAQLEAVRELCDEVERGSFGLRPYMVRAAIGTAGQP